MSGDNNSGTGIPVGSRAEAFGRRKSPTVFYAARTPPFGWIEKDGKTVPRGGLFWDGRVNTLAEQAKLPFLDAREMANTDVKSVAAKLASTRYAAEFKSVYGDDIFNDPEKAFSAAADALGTLQSSVNFQPYLSKFDRHLRGTATLSEQEQRGLALFTIKQKGNCIACHTANPDSKDPRDWVFTDFTFHAVGVPRNAAIKDNRNPAHFDRGLCDAPHMQVHPQRENYCGWFKTPTLRNVERTAPYMHNAAFKTLRDAVAFYATRDTDPARWYLQPATGKTKKFDDLEARHHGNIDRDTPPYHREGRRAALNDEEIDDIVAFLRTLTDTREPARTGAAPASTPSPAPTSPPSPAVTSPKGQ
jgi:cytochrome c peroxidase